MAKARCAGAGSFLIPLTERHAGPMVPDYRRIRMDRIGRISVVYRHGIFVQGGAGPPQAAQAARPIKFIETSARVTDDAMQILNPAVHDDLAHGRRLRLNLGGGQRAMPGYYNV